MSSFRWLLALPAVAACSSPTGSTGGGGIDAAVADLRLAATQAVVSDLFEATAYVTSALASGAGGCTWMFDFPSRSYQGTACGGAVGTVTIYAAAEPDLPHQGTAFLLAFPLEPIGTLEFGREGCPGGLRVVSARILLTACPEDDGGWSAMLHHLQATYHLEGTTASLSGPARTRHVIVMRGPNGTATLQHDIVAGIERSENVITVERGGREFRMAGYAGAVGPAYEATLDGVGAGSISWQGNAGFVASGPFNATLSASEEQRLHDGEHLIRALSRMGAGVAALVM